MAELAAITFDFWNTLVRQQTAELRDIRRRLVADALVTIDEPREAEVIEAAFDVVREQFDEHWKDGKQFVMSNAVDVFIRILGIEHGDVNRTTLEAAWLVAGQNYPVELVEPGLGKTLSGLRDTGVRLGIICDVGLIPSSVLIEHLETFGLKDYFDHWSFSDTVGYYKPAPEIFAHAHQGLGVTDPSATLHIGDLRRTDVAGARAFGARSARYRSAFDDTDDSDAEADHVVDSHQELLDLI